jgi:hypothetical protein
MHVQDDLYTGHPRVSIRTTAQDDPTNQLGVGPLGRVAFLNVTPPTAQAAGYAALQASVANAALALTPGVGITRAAAPDGSGNTVLLTDTPNVGRGVSLTSVSNLSAINYTMVAYDIYGQRLTSTIAGPNNNTVKFPKTVASVLSVTPNGASASLVSVGTADLFGLPFVALNGAYVQDMAWNALTGGSSGANGQNSFALDTGTFVSADTTNPATSLTGDPRGTYAPSSASDGNHQLLIMMHLDGTQAGANSTRQAAIGVTQA